MAVDNYFYTLFDDCATHCEAYAECGGFRATTPCGCAWPRNSDLWHQCHKCYLICRERSAFISADSNNPRDFATCVAEGCSIDQLALSQPALELPSFIATYTERYHGTVLPIKWAAIDVRSLFNVRKRDCAEIQPRYISAEATRTHLNVDNNCHLLAVLNGKDWMLESIWGMPRRSLFQKLALLGFTAVTGPTFSVTNLTHQSTLVPYAHHMAMLMRHHQVIAEIQEAGLCAIPNLYWIDDEKRDLDYWVKWLKANPDVRFISRDFTCTSHWETISPKLTELIYILQQVGRPFHVVIVGSGPANAPRFVRALTRAGHKTSIVTSAPIHKALRGCKYDIDAHGEVLETACDKSSYSFDALILHNLKQFEQLMTLSPNYPQAKGNHQSVRVFSAG